jgi:hypothetical protein
MNMKLKRHKNKVLHVSLASHSTLGHSLSNRIHSARKYTTYTAIYSIFIKMKMKPKFKIACFHKHESRIPTIDNHTRPNADAAELTHTPRARHTDRPRHPSAALRPHSHYSQRREKAPSLLSARFCAKWTPAATQLHSAALINARKKKSKE